LNPPPPRCSTNKTFVAFALGAVFLSCLVASSSAAGISVPDDTGIQVNLPSRPERIVSLAPGATEMLFAAGAGSQVVATVEYADEPPAAKLIPRIGDVVAVDMERLVAARPQVVIVWPGGGNAAQIEEVIRMGLPVYRQQTNTLAGMAASIRRLGILAGTSVIADAAAKNLELRLATLTREHASGPHPRVLMEVWNHPVYTVGGPHLMSDSLRACGARNVFGDLDDLGPAVDLEAVVARDPDIIVAASPQGSSQQWLDEWRRFRTLRAVRDNRLIGFEDPRLTRLGPSVIDATEALCRVLAAAYANSPPARPRVSP
jgi:iron complex transport system substrate-binding protein